jgi:ABC-type glycerol-3-phosphate transport system substrate-binding protein
MIPALTLQDNNNGFTESGIALGTYTVPYMKDILMAIVSQLGQTPVLLQYKNDGTRVYDISLNTPTTDGGSVLPFESAVRFMTEFTDPLKSTYTWNQFAGNPADLFVAEKLAMYIGYAGELPVLRARNPKMNIDMTYLPQTRNYNTFATGMRLYGVAVMRQSKNPTASFAVESAFAGAEWSSQLAPLVGASPALRAYLATPGINDVIQKSLLVTRGWYDIDQQSTGGLIAQMFADIGSRKQGTIEAASTFASRMYDLYTHK